MKKRYVQTVLFIVLLVVSMAATACGGGGEESTTTTSIAPATGEPILVGLSNSLTGVAAAAGISVQRGVEFQAKLINDNGGINGRPIKIIAADDKSDVQVIVANFTKNIEQDKVDALIGPFVNYGQAAARALAEQAHVPMVTPGPELAANITDPAKQMKWSVSNGASSPAVADALTKLIAQEGWKNILAMGDVLPIDQETIDLLAEGASAGGYKITKMKDAPGFGLTDFSPFINKIKAEYDKVKPDVILLLAQPFSAAPIYKGLRAFGITVPIEGGPVPASPDLFSMGPGAVEGFMVMDSGGIANPQAMPATWPIRQLQLDFVAQYTAAYGAAPNITAAMGADMVIILAEAWRQAGGPDDKAKVAGALVNLKDIPTYEGVISFSPEDTSQGLDGGQIGWTAKDGQFTDPQILN
jgi:branched-chain amino acid transport system substrate-binding protein